MNLFISKSLRRLDRLQQRLNVNHHQKIFCIGKAKTGTTSLKKTFKDIGYLVGDQRTAERLLPYYIKKDFKPILKYCRSAQVFQDHPFGLPETFMQVDREFPESKFILSVRDTPEQWYNSLVTFHSKLFGGGSVPTANHLKNAEYIWEGWVWESLKEQYGVTEADPYNKEKLIDAYLTHNQTVIDYFKYRPESLLVLNLSEEDSFNKFKAFIIHVDPGTHYPNTEIKAFPWKNRTADIAVR